MSKIGYQTTKYISAWKSQELTNDKVNDIISSLHKIESDIKSSRPDSGDDDKYVIRKERLLYWLPKITAAMRAKQAIGEIVRSFSSDTK